LKKTAAELNNINGAADISELINQLTGEKWCWLMYSLVWKILGFSFMFICPLSTSFMINSSLSKPLFLWSHACYLSYSYLWSIHLSHECHLSYLFWWLIELLIWVPITSGTPSITFNEW
jgi:hypothetical protein